MAKTNVFGTQPSVASRGRGKGPGMNRGGGPGRGGGGVKRGSTPAKKIPNTPLYGGKAGKALANQDPEKFVQDLLAKAGMLDYSGTEYGDWSNTALPASILAQYGAAGADAQRMGVAKWAKQTYGAGWGKKKGSFKQGNLAAATGPLGEEFIDFQSNTNPGGYGTKLLTQQGGVIPAGGNQDFQAAVQTEFLPQIASEWSAATNAGQSGVSFDDFLAGRDIANEARRWYAMRGSARRQPGPISPQGRYSWYD